MMERWKRFLVGAMLAFLFFLPQAYGSVSGSTGGTTREEDPEICALQNKVIKDLGLKPCEFHDEKDLSTRRVILAGVSYTAEKSKIMQLEDAEKNFPGMHPVRKYLGIYYKKSKEYYPVDAGNQTLVYLWMKKLFSQGVAPSLLIHVSKPWKKKYDTYQASQAVEGKDLEGVLKLAPETLDPESVSQQMVGSLFVRTGDFSLRNSKVTDSKIISFDDDISFNDWFGQRDWQIVDGHTNFRNVLYLDPYWSTQSVTPKVRKRMLEVSPMKMILEQFATLKAWNKMFKKESLELKNSHYAYERLDLPLCLCPEFVVQSLREMEAVRSYLRFHEVVPHRYLLQIVNPVVSKCYEVVKGYKLGIEDAYHFFVTGYNFQGRHVSKFLNLKSEVNTGQTVQSYIEERFGEECPLSLKKNLKNLLKNWDAESYPEEERAEIFEFLETHFSDWGENKWIKKLKERDFAARFSKLIEYEPLESLTLPGPIYDVGVHALKNTFLEREDLDQLEDFNLQGSYLTSKCARSLNDIFFKAKWIKELNLHNNLLGDSGVGILAEGLLALEHLKVLNLSRNNLTAQGVENLKEALQRVHAVNLEENALRDAGAEVLLPIVKSNKRLRDLFVGWNYLSEETCMLLKEAMMQKMGTPVIYRYDGNF